jgi:hypothetical protein
VCSEEPGVVYSIAAVSTAAIYNWKVPAGATIVSGNGTTSITVDFGAGVGDVCVNAENPIGVSADQCLAINSASCATAPATPGTINGLVEVCSEEAGVVYSIDAVSTAVGYNWTVPTGATIVSGDGTTSITVDFGTDIGEVCVNAENPIGVSADQCLAISAASCGSAPDSPSSIDGLTEVCADDTGISYTIAAVATATTYNWTVPAGATITSGVGTTSITVDFGAGVGDVCVNAENSIGVSADQCLVISASNSCGSAPSSPGNIEGLTEICASQTAVAFSISDVAGATTYNWKVPVGATITSGQGTTSVNVDFGVSAGKVCVNAGNEFGSSADQCLMTTLCEVTGVRKFTESSSQLKIYPNPVFNGKLTILGGFDWYAIFDINGAKVMQSDVPVIKVETVISLDDFDKGVYFINVQRGEVILYERIIVE